MQVLGGISVGSFLKIDKFLTFFYLKWPFPEFYGACYITLYCISTPHTHSVETINTYIHFSTASLTVMIHIMKYCTVCFVGYAVFSNPVLLQGCY